MGKQRGWKIKKVVSFFKKVNLILKFKTLPE